MNSKSKRKKKATNSRWGACFTFYKLANAGGTTRKKKSIIKLEAELQNNAMIHANLAIARQGRLDGVAPRTEIADCEILEFYRHIDGNNLLECAPPNSASDFRGPGRTCPPPQPSHQPSAEESNSSLQPNESDGGGGKYSISTSFLVSPFFFFLSPLSLSYYLHKAWVEYRPLHVVVADRPFSGSTCEYVPVPSDGGCVWGLTRFRALASQLALPWKR